MRHEHSAKVRGLPIVYLPRHRLLDAERTAFAAALVSVPSCLVCVLFLGAGVPRVLSVVLAAAVAAGGTVYLRGHLRRDDQKGRLVSVLWGLVALLALVQTVRLSGFMLDQTKASESVTPWSRFMTNHSCPTAYFEAARVVRDVPNIYDPTIYRPTPAGRFIGRFRVDTYEYPPPFLLLPKAALSLSDDFQKWRPAWFAVSGLAVLGSLFVLGSFLGGREGFLFTMLIPAVWISLPTLLALQMGNIQLFVVAIALVAMVSFERGRRPIGGILLAFAIVTKIFPAILLLLLAFQRRWRDIAWSLCGCALLVVTGFIVLGRAPYTAFVHEQVPRLSSGEAFPMLKAIPWTVAINDSVYGLPLKLRLLGVGWMGLRSASIVAWVYTAALAGLAFFVRGARSPLELGATWLGLLGLASMRSPFLPQEYALFIPLCLMALVAAHGPFSIQRAALLAAGYLALSVNLPIEAPIRLPVVMLIATAIQLFAAVLMVRALLRVRGHAFNSATGT